MTTEYQNITVRVPRATVEDLKKLAAMEEKRTGLRVDLSSVVRRALQQTLETTKGKK
jgi:Arc/MetJ-type ribon-helix-helix transcriptional regulator